ncbi:hypothetical protein ACWCQ1_32980 [Streptomyces sp. NPDC002144]
MCPVAEQAERIAAARADADEAGLPRFSDARIDTCHRGPAGTYGSLVAVLEYGELNALLGGAR